MTEPIRGFGWGPLGVLGVMITGGFVAVMAWRSWYNNGGREHVPRDFIAFLMVTAFLGAVLYALTSGETTQLDILIGALIGAVGAIIGFYFNVPPSSPP
jgi:heme O synthase-like polyprenyltransferase